MYKDVYLCALTILDVPGAKMTESEELGFSCISNMPIKGNVREDKLLTFIIIIIIIILIIII